MVVTCLKCGSSKVILTTQIEVYFKFDNNGDVDCRKSIHGVCKEAWLNGVIKFKEGKLWHRKDFLRMRKGVDQNESQH